jgi:hypothetical protein
VTTWSHAFSAELTSAATCAQPTGPGTGSAEPVRRNARRGLQRGMRPTRCIAAQATAAALAWRDREMVEVGGGIRPFVDDVSEGVAVVPALRETLAPRLELGFVVMNDSVEARDFLGDDAAVRVDEVAGTRTAQALPLGEAERLADVPGLPNWLTTNIFESGAPLAMTSRGRPCCTCR